jgi:hypothetical protein
MTPVADAAEDHAVAAGDDALYAAHTASSKPSTGIIPGG